MCATFVLVLLQWLFMWRQSAVRRLTLEYSAISKRTIYLSLVRKTMKNVDNFFFMLDNEISRCFFCHFLRFNTDSIAFAAIRCPAFGKWIAWNCALISVEHFVASLLRLCSGKSQVIDFDTSISLKKQWTFFFVFASKKLRSIQRKSFFFQLLKVVVSFLCRVSYTCAAKSFGCYATPFDSFNSHIFPCK